jgi:ParB family chromosome partitioning protein
VSIGKEIIARGLSVHATEAYVKQLALEPKEPAANGGGGGRAAPEKTNHVQGLEDELRQKLGLKVEIRVKAKDKGQIVLTFDSNDDFERMLDVLRR